VVDSTWHHFFDVNLTGRMNFGTDDPGGLFETSDVRKLNGFNDTAEGKEALARIKNYFRNIAIWLAPPAAQKCMARRGLWGTIFRYPLIEELEPSLSVLEKGRLAVDALTKLAGPCAVRVWWPYFLRVPIERLIDPRVARVEALEDLDAYVLGGIVQEMMQAQSERFPAGKLPEDDELETLAQRGAEKGITTLLVSVQRAAEVNREVADRLKQMMGENDIQADAQAAN
jgi:hypothetical protein